MLKLVLAPPLDPLVPCPREVPRQGVNDERSRFRPRSVGLVHFEIPHAPFLTWCLRVFNSIHFPPTKHTHVRARAHKHTYAHKIHACTRKRPKCYPEDSIKKGRPVHGLDVVGETAGMHGT